VTGVLTVRTLPKKTLAPKSETSYIDFMRVISRKMIKEFWEIHPDAEQQLRAWYTKTKLAKWKSSSDIKNDYRNASFVANTRVVFNIKGNNYRLIAAINYQFGIVCIRFVGTHKDYDKIDATLI
jgi:mRNA interferase HigB